MEKFWNNEELEVMELLNSFTLPKKIEILKISIEQEMCIRDREYYLFVFSEDEERHNDYISLITKSLGTNTLLRAQR